MKIADVYSEMPEFETERVKLRKLGIEDEQDIFEYCSDEEVARYTAWSKHETIEDTREYLRRVLEKYSNASIAPWGIEEKKTGKFIGTAGFMSWNIYHSKADLGYALSKAYWNQGYMTEVIRRIIEFGFERMNLIRIEASCLPKNIGSAKVMEKVGMEYEGILRKTIYVKGRYEDLKVYSIVREE